MTISQVPLGSHPEDFYFTTNLPKQNICTHTENSQKLLFSTIYLSKM